MVLGPARRSVLAAVPACRLWIGVLAASVLALVLWGHLQEEQGVADLAAEHPGAVAWGPEAHLLWPQAQLGREVGTGAAAEEQDGEAQNLSLGVPAALMDQPWPTKALGPREDNAPSHWDTSGSRR